MADDVLKDYEAGLEYAPGRRVLAARRGAVTEYLVEWEDGAPPSWEAEEHVAEELMRVWLDERKAAKAARAAAR